MPLGIVSDDDFSRELERNDRPVAVVQDIVRGRGSKPNVPESLRKIIGENAIIEGSQETKEMTRALGISDSSLSAYKHGANSTTDYNTPQFSKYTDEVKLKVSKKAKARLMMTLNHITPEKLKEAKITDVARVAYDLATVIDKMQPNVIEYHGAGFGEQNNTQIVVYAPQVRQEKEFETIVARD